MEHFIVQLIKTKCISSFTVILFYTIYRTKNLFIYKFQAKTKYAI